MTLIGLVGVLAVPWMAKVLWAPLVDRHELFGLGRRRGWIVVGQSGIAICALLASLSFTGGSWGVLFALIFLMNVFSATQDIAVDGWAVDMLGTEELGPGNAAQVVGFKFGMLTSGGLLLWVSETIGNSGIFISIAGLVTIVLLVVLQVPERSVHHSPLPDDESPSVKEIFTMLWRTLSDRSGLFFLLAILGYKVGESMIDTMFKPFLFDVGYTKAQIGLWLGIWGMGFSIAGSVVGGLLAKRVGIWTAVFIASVFRVFPLVGEWWLTTLGAPQPDQIIPILCAEHFFGGVLTTTMFAWMMSRIDKKIGASHFTALATVEVFGKAPASWLSGFFAQRGGYSFVFAAGAIASVLFIFILPFARNHHSSPLE